jgi:hypothetical protein
MHGHASRHGTSYAYCQPRNREQSGRHRAAIWVREEQLIDAAMWFFNNHVRGPERLALVQATMQRGQ